MQIQVATAGMFLCLSLSLPFPLVCFQLLVGQEDLQQLIMLGKNFGERFSRALDKGEREGVRDSAIYFIKRVKLSESYMYIYNLVNSN